VQFILLCTRAFVSRWDCARLWCTSGDRYRALALTLAVSIGPRSSRYPPASAVAGLFVRTGHPDAHDPYFLYAASNVGSFLALLAYPALFEPVFTLQMQNRMWSFGFVLLILLVAGCAVLILRAPRRRAAEPRRSKAAPEPTWPRLTLGFCFAVPSGLLVVTAYISTDVPRRRFMGYSLRLSADLFWSQRRPPDPSSIALQPCSRHDRGATFLYDGSRYFSIWWPSTGLSLLLHVTVNCPDPAARAT
jgi:hypothetical protein